MIDEHAPDSPTPAPSLITDGDGEVVTCGNCEAEFQGGDACPVCGRLQVEVACEAHADRMAPGRCVVCGRAVCEACRAGESHAYLCEDHRTVSVIGGWAQVYTTTTEFEAQLVKENLRAEGRDARVFSQRDRAFSVDLGELSIVRVLVPVWEYGAALQVIRDHMGSGGEVAFACPSCAEAYEPGARECAACGAPLS
jgi:hypothetical protein